MEKHAYAEMQRMQSRHWWWRGMRRLYHAALRRYLPTTNHQRLIADIGCGFGGNIATLAHYGKVVAVDVSTEALAVIPLLPADYQPVLRVQAAADALPFRSDTFDLVALLAVVEHAEDDAQVLRESHRVTKRGGVQLLLTSAFMLLWSHHDVANLHKRRYVAAQLDAVQEQGGWHTLRTAYVNAFLFPAVLLVRLLQRWRRRLSTSHQPAEGKYDMGPELGVLSRIPESLLALEGYLFAQGWLLSPFGVDLLSVSRRDGNNAD
jgi:SAM-dependent methyltransferase